MKENTSNLAVDFNQNRGIATSVNLLLNGKEITFKLSILAADSHYEELGTTYFLSYATDDTYFYSLYQSSCGRSNYFGCENFKNLQEKDYDNQDIRIVTQDIKEILKMVEEANQKEKQEKEDFDKRQFEKADRINKLPERFEIEGFPELYIERRKAEYNPRWSSKIKGGDVISINFKDKNDWISPNNYVGKYNQRLEVKKFANHYSSLIGNRDPREVLQKLVDEFNKVKQLVRNA